MITKPKAKNYRTRRDVPLTPDAAPPGLVSSQAVPRPTAVPTPPVSERQAEESPPPQGEVTSAKEVATNLTIDEIRREGLTGRQLRMARRVAQKNNMAPTSDFDAVLMLRKAGIDPFSRTNMLQLVSNETDAPPTPAPASPPSTGGAVAPIGQIQLPQTVKEKPDSLPSTEVKDVAESRASDILKIQRQIAKRRRRKLLLLCVRLAFFVFLPTFLAGFYYTFVASPLYATKSEFTIQQAEGQGAGGLGSLFQGTSLSGQQDSITVQSYLQSRDAMLRLDQELGFKAHWSGSDIDPIQHLAAGATNEAAYKIYTSKVKIGYDPTEGLLRMEVIAADPQTSQAFSERLIDYAEEQVDNLTQRLRSDQMKGASESFQDAERKVLEAQQRVLSLQERRGIIDPVSETGGLMQQIVQFETQLRLKQLEVDQLLANPRPNTAKVNGVRGDIQRLEALVAELRASMTSTVDGSVSLARISGELRIAEADLATRQLLLQQAAAQLETARIEANRQTRYITVGVSPIAPDEATYPRAFENTLLAFFVFAGIYLMLSLTASVLKEQVSA